MPAPKLVPAQCDVPGCGMPAIMSTDGTEKDIAKKRVTNKDGDTRDELLNRPAAKDVNVCDRHRNWPHSDDAHRFVASDDFKKQKRG